ncbi:MAG: hypothetical protein ACREAZ_00155 [Nitrososphaera sp.]
MISFGFAYVNFNTPTQDLSDWVFMPAFVMLYFALPLGAILITLGVSLNTRGEKIVGYSTVIGVGVAIILVWVALWGIWLIRISLIS